MSKRRPPHDHDEPYVAPRGPRRQQAVALEWDRQRAPRITASGSGVTAEQILRIAEEHGIPLHQDPGLTEALAQVPLGEEVPESLYVAVAEVLAYVFVLAGITPEDREQGYRRDDSTSGE
ncbi:MULTISPECIES: EscU/YscU/HrcU family type III secretion system export apparatus switch protein [unclassified Thioalkalivibrio]|uniref:EscU/YscU/HrcU family type III secretion system export apparatus switch protein n=1 Tax=unclassified Thioalkalivibrio TaxID=2621013 RepID=UPI000367FB67|nr:MULTISPECIES: EscU/YscU/HrcU family type III secretion system export apparatus switch protein [unclassified Thioalkalivibrio]